MGRKKRGDDFLDLPDPDAEGQEAAVEEAAPAAVKQAAKKNKKGSKAVAAFADGAC